MAKLEFNDELSKVQEAISSTPHFGEQRAWTLEAMALKFGDHVLDLGSGTGHFVVELAEAGFSMESPRALVTLETQMGHENTSQYITKYAADYVLGNGVGAAIVNEWRNDLAALKAQGDYFYSINSYIFVGEKSR